MPRNITVTFADGTSHVYQNAPDDVTPDAVQSRAEKQFAKTVKGIDGGAKAAPEEVPKEERSTASRLLSLATPASAAAAAFTTGGREDIKAGTMGALRGAKDVIDTGAEYLAKGYDKITGADAPNVSSLVTGQKPGESARVRQMNDAGKQEFEQQYGNNPVASVGRTAGQVAVTWPVGGVLAAPVRAVGATRLASALQTGGMTTGAPAAVGVGAKAADMGIRMAGGAATGGVSAGLVDPNTAGTGALIGGAVPPVIKAMGAAGSGVASVWRSLMTSGDRAGAQALEKSLMIANPVERQAIIEKLRSAETLVDDASPTVAQALGTPGASIVSRVVHDSPGGEVLRQKLAQQNAARSAALERVAPTDANGFSQARADLGEAITSRVIPEEKGISKRISSLYENVDPTGRARVQLPVDEMRGAVDKYLGPGSFGHSGDAQRAVSTAEALTEKTGTSSLTNNPGVPTTTWRETQRLRSSIGEAIQKAKEAGNKQEAAALTSQLKSLDATIEGIANGSGRFGEAFPADMVARWKDANAAFATKMERFHTGPQAAIFRQRNGVPLAEGGGAAQLFWGQGPKAAENVQAFRRLVDDNPHMLDRFKSMVTTQGAGTADAAQNLTTKFSKWVKQSLPGLREAFTPEEVTQMQRIAADIDRAAAANKAGTSIGGSNTYQNASNALNLGLLDSPAVGRAANMIPGIRLIGGPLLEGVRGHARSAKAERLARLLSDSRGAADALEALSLKPTQKTSDLLRLLGTGAARTLPVGASQ